MHIARERESERASERESESTRERERARERERERERASARKRARDWAPGGQHSRQSRRARDRAYTPRSLPQRARAAAAQTSPRAAKRSRVISSVSFCTFVLVKQVNWGGIPHTRRALRAPSLLSVSLYFCTSKASKVERYTSYSPRFTSSTNCWRITRNSSSG